MRKFSSLLRMDGPAVTVGLILPLFTAVLSGCGGNSSAPRAATGAGSTDRCTQASWHTSDGSPPSAGPNYRIKSASVASDGPNVVMKINLEGPMVPTDSSTLSPIIPDSWGVLLADPRDHKNLYEVAVAPDAATVGKWDYSTSYAPDFEPSNPNTKLTTLPASGSVNGSTVTLTVPATELSEIPTHPDWQAVVSTFGGSYECPTNSFSASDIALPSGTAVPVPATAAPTNTTIVPGGASQSVGTKFQGMNLADAIKAGEAGGEAVQYVGGGDLGIVDPSNWTPCFVTEKANTLTFFAAKSCNSDSNSQSGGNPPTGVAAGLVGKNLAAAESSLSTSGYGYYEIGGGDLGIIVRSDWTVCYADNNSLGAVELYAAKDCTPRPAG